MKEWVAPGSNNALDVCPDKVIIPSTTEVEALASCWVNADTLPWVRGYCTDDWVVTCLGIWIEHLELFGWSSWRSYSSWRSSHSCCESWIPLQYCTVPFYVSHFPTGITTSFLSTDPEISFVALMAQRGSCRSKVRQWCSLCTLKVSLVLSHTSLPILMPPDAGVTKDHVSLFILGPDDGF